MIFKMIDLHFCFRSR